MFTGDLRTHRTIHAQAPTPLPVVGISPNDEQSATGADHQHKYTPAIRSGDLLAKARRRLLAAKASASIPHKSQTDTSHISCFYQMMASSFATAQTTAFAN